MNIGNINLKKIEKFELIENLKKRIIINPTKKELKKNFTVFENAFFSGDFLTARNSLIISVFFQCDDTFDKIKRKGIFRYSKYINKKCIVENIAIEIKDICNDFGFLSNSLKIYLESIINYSSILESYKSFDKFILLEIRKFEKKYPQKSLIKTLLSAIDYLFLSNYYPNETVDLSNLFNRSKEEISSATSFLIHFYTNRVKSKEINIHFVAEEFILSNDISKLIIPVCYHLDFREFEILIDHFNYSCEKNNDALLIKPPFENFEKAIRLGYVRTEIQKINDNAEPINAISMEDLVNEFNNQDSFDFFKLIDTHNYQRYRIEIPEPVFDMLIEKFIKPDTLFKDEVIYLSSIFKEQLLNIESLNNRIIKDDLTLGEFMKIRRIFVIFYLFFSTAIFKNEKKESKLVLRSLIPTFPEETFYYFIERLLPQSKIDSFLDIVCWEPELDSIFDLQYHPIQFIDNKFLVALSIFANSNTIRNLYASEYKINNTQLLSNGEIDPLVDKLHSSLQEASLQSFSQTPIQFSDIDEFAIFEDVLFVFECKHSLHPVSLFDLRTTYDYIKKAESQLDLIIKDFNNGNLIKKLEDKHNIKLNDIKKIQGAIILSNRLFNGNIFKYPVRGINEIDNMLNRGTLRTSEGSFWLWKEKKLTVDFLLDYLSLENELVSLMYESLSKKRLTYEFANPVVEFDTYYLEIEKANNDLKIYTDRLEATNDK
jgi:hypothetical protein